MIILRNFFLSTLFIILSCTAAHPTVNSNGSFTEAVSLPATLGHRALSIQAISALNKRTIYTWGKWHVNMWRTVAVLPLMTATLDMKDFYNEVMVAANTEYLSKLVTSTYTVTLGCMRLFVDTLDGSPIEWAFVAHFGEKMLAMTNKGWTDHYMATFHNANTGTIVLVSVQAVSAAGVASLGFLQGLDSGGSAIRGAAPIGD